MIPGDTVTFTDTHHAYLRELYAVQNDPAHRPRGVLLWEGYDERDHNHLATVRWDGDDAYCKRGTLRHSRYCAGQVLCHFYENLRGADT